MTPSNPKGTGEQAIEWVLQSKTKIPEVFLRDWRKGDLTLWRDYRDWLAKRTRTQEQPHD